MKTDLEIIALYKKAKEKEKRYWAKQALIMQKAKAKGITVTEVEVDAYLAKKS
jgi:hypothetical protein